MGIENVEEGRYARGSTFGDACEVCHFFLETFPGERVVDADSHLVRGGDNEGEFAGFHGLCF